MCCAMDWSKLGVHWSSGCIGFVAVVRCIGLVVVAVAVVVVVLSEVVAVVVGCSESVASK